MKALHARQFAGSEQLNPRGKFQDRTTAIGAPKATGAYRS